MALTKQHLKAAEILAKGGTFRMAGRATGVPISTIHRWKSEDPEFRALIDSPPESRVQAVLRSQMREKRELEEYRDTELVLLAGLAEKLEKMSEILDERLKTIKLNEVRDIPVRIVPQLLKSFTDGLSVLQSSHDRISGYHTLLAEVEKRLPDAESPCD